MALIKMIPVGSGGSDTVKHDKSDATSTANSTITINTGLTTITRFVWFAKSNATNLQAIITYDSTVDANKFNVATIGANSGYYQKTIGSVAGADYVTLTSITGGTITITTATGSNIGILNQGYWYAE